MPAYVNPATFLGLISFDINRVLLRYVDVEETPWHLIPRGLALVSNTFAATERQKHSFTITHAVQRKQRENKRNTMIKLGFPFPSAECLIIAIVEIGISCSATELNVKKGTHAKP